jgi:uncharacterized protein YkwD
LILGLALCAAGGVRADPAAVVNALRGGGCRGQPAAASAARVGVLDAAARELARGTRLGNALDRVGYAAATSTSFHVRGSREDAAIERILAERYCDSIRDARYGELGVYQNGDETWIVLAARQKPPPTLDFMAVSARVLELVNRARGEARRCGAQRLDAAGPLALAPALTSAALLHAQEMAKRRELTHTGADGSDSGVRITRAGYAWRASGENVAAGQQDADAVVRAWLESPGHCATLMGPHFTEMGIGFALAPGQNPGIYWAQTFGTPR